MSLCIWIERNDDELEVAMSVSITAETNVDTLFNELRDLSAVDRACLADRLLESVGLTNRPDQDAQDDERRALSTRIGAQIERVQRQIGAARWDAVDRSRIIDRGRGPEVVGSRITIFDVMDYLKHGWDQAQIAALFRLGVDDVLAAIEHIARDLDRCVDDYVSILEEQRGRTYPPDVQARVNEAHGRFMQRVKEIREGGPR
jgi:uncharacterized protein (DUF433 family)